MSLEAALTNSLDIAHSAQAELVGTDPHEHALHTSAAQGLPSIAIAPAQGAQLSILCQLIQAQRVLEIGTLGGYSTLWFANSVPNLQVTSIEFNPKHRNVALKNTSHCKNVKIILGAALDVLPTLQDQEPPFDLVFIDADWEPSVEYFDWAVKLTRKGGCIYYDNVVKQLTKGRGSGRALIEHVKKDERVQASLIPTAHKKGREAQRDVTEFVDGYLIAVVK